MQPGVKVNGAYYCNVLLLKQFFCHRPVKLLATCFLAHHNVHKNTELLRHKIPDFTSHLASQQIRPQFCRLQIIESFRNVVYQKQQGTSNIVDELWLLTKWHFIKSMTYYISQGRPGRVETPVWRNEQFCCSFVANLLQYLHKKLSKYNVVWQSYRKNKKGAIFFCSAV